MGNFIPSSETKEKNKSCFLYTKLLNDTFGQTCTYTEKETFFFGGIENEFTNIDLKMMTFSEGIY